MIDFFEDINIERIVLRTSTPNANTTLYIKNWQDNVIQTESLEKNKHIKVNHVKNIREIEYSHTNDTISGSRSVFIQNFNDGFDCFSFDDIKIYAKVSVDE